MFREFAHYLVFLFFVLFTHVQAVVYVTNGSLPTNNITDECYSALTIDISCNDTLQKLRPRLYYPESILTNLCTSDCNSALNNFETAVQTACGNQTYYDLSEATDLPLYTIVEVLRYQFNISCLTSNGEYCNYLAATAAGINADQTNLSKCGKWLSD